MKTRYVVKCTSIATEENVNFAGDVNYFFYGKGMQNLKPYDYNNGDDLPSEYTINECGYTTYAAAVRGIKALQKVFNDMIAMGDYHWNESFEIIKI